MVGSERYEIRVEGLLDEGWSERRGGLAVRQEASGTVLTGRLPDQAALHGVLARIRDLNLTLVSVSRVRVDPPGAEQAG